MPRLIIKQFKRRLTETERQEIGASRLSVKETAEHYGVNIGMVYTCTNNRKKKTNKL